MKHKVLWMSITALLVAGTRVAEVQHAPLVRLAELASILLG